MKKIAILGTAPSWKQAPLHDSDWEIWVCNITGMEVERWDRLFEIHRRWEESDKEYLEEIKTILPPKKVMSIIPLGGPANIVIDRAALAKKYGAIWLSSSLAYMLAIAIDEGATDIGIWGVDMESREEYVVQFSGCRHFIDLAKFVGIKIHMPDRCLLLREPEPYPDRFETMFALTMENKAKRIEGLIDQSERRLERTKREMYYLDGKIDAIEAYEKTDEYPGSIMEDREKLKNLPWRVETLTKDLARLKGELWATQQYKRLFVWNVLPPDSDEVTFTDIENSGPI